MTGFYATGEVATGSTAATVTDTTAPTLTAASATATGPTTATGSVTTNESGGTLYWLVNTSATATAAQVKAGSSKAVITAGAQTVSVASLAASTLYCLHFLHADGATPANESAVANSASFTTQAAASTITSVTVTPSTATLAGGATVDFDWVINGTNSPSQAATVTTSLGTINSAGVLTAPAATSSAQSGTVTVTSTQDPTKSGTATFTVAALAPAPDTAGPVMQGAISFTKTTSSISLSWPAATDSSGIREYLISRDGNAAVSNGTARTADFAGLTALSTHQFVITATDTLGNVSSNSLAATVQTDPAAGVYATYVEEIFIDSASAVRANLSGMRWYVWAETGSTAIGAPIGQGNIETTDSGGVCRMDISGQSSVMPGAPVRLGFTNDNGDPGQTGLFSWFGTVLAH